MPDRQSDEYGDYCYDRMIDKCIEKGQRPPSSEDYDDPIEFNVRLQTPEDGKLQLVYVEWTRNLDRARREFANWKNACPHFQPELLGRNKVGIETVMKHLMY